MLNTNIGYLDNCKLIKDNVLSHDDCDPVGFFWYVELSTCTVLLMIVQSPSKYIYHYLTEAGVFLLTDYLGCSMYLPQVRELGETLI